MEQGGRGSCQHQRQILVSRNCPSTTRNGTRSTSVMMKMTFTQISTMLHSFGTRTERTCTNATIIPDYACLMACVGTSSMQSSICTPGVYVLPRTKRACVRYDSRNVVGEERDGVYVAKESHRGCARSTLTMTTMPWCFCGCVYVCTCPCMHSYVQYEAPQPH